ncbi:hypothetical protein [Paracoccus sp. (in: a-proteobacteria)]|uniref:hypothetical protein n=1 Tax=Paracoccus sp. TaxID=267 RepID=UPI00396C7073
MKFSAIRSLAAIALIWLSGLVQMASADTGHDEAWVYFFGNSLIHHLTDSPETAVPHWLALMAEADGRTFAAEGRWGFPRDMADELPPHANWNFPAVSGAWDPYTESFRDAAFDTVILNPENFIQYNRVDEPYLGDNPDNATPLGATLVILDWVLANSGTQRFMIYEGWADLNPFAKSLPATSEQMKQYYNYAQGQYADWYDDYVARLSAERPDARIELIPVGRIMAQVLNSEPLSALSTDVFYSDLSPHGTATTYFLAAMITFAALYAAPPPAGLPLPDSIDAAFAAAYDTTADAIWSAMQAD